MKEELDKLLGQTVTVYIKSPHTIGMAWICGKLTSHGRISIYMCDTRGASVIFGVDDVDHVWPCGISEGSLPEIQLKG